MREKDIYKLLNNSKIEKPESIEGISTMEREKLKTNFLKNIGRPKKKKNTFLKLGLAAAILIFLFSFTKPGEIVYAKLVEWYELMVNPIGQYAIDSEGIEKSITKLDKTVVKNGIKLTVKELILLDDNILYANIIYEIIDEDLKENFDEDPSLTPASQIGLLLNGENRIDGKPLLHSSGTVKSTIPNNRSQQQFFHFKINEDINIEDEDVLTLIFREFTIIDFNKVDWNKENFGIDYVKKIDGEVNISLKVADIKKELNTKVYPINLEISGENETIILENLRLNSFIARLNYRTNNYEENRNKTLFFKARDENNNEYIFNKFSDYKGQSSFMLDPNGINNAKILKAKSLKIQAFYSFNGEEEKLEKIGEEVIVNLK